MDRDHFDALARLLAASPSRRAALGALLGAGLAGTVGAAEAARKDRGKHRKARKRRNRRKDRTGRGAAELSAEAADCLSPGPSSNMNGCNFAGSDFAGDDLSGSSMVGTNFNNARLVGADLSSSNMKNAAFRGANLTCADLSSSTLRNADFRGFPVSGPNPGPPTDLTLADLRSSGGCGTIQTNNRTTFCATRMCDGSLRNDDCPPGFDPENACCADADCPSGETCVGNQCARVCPVRGHNEPCQCLNKRVGGGMVCANPTSLCFVQTCNADAECPSGQTCVTIDCAGGTGRCAPPCPSPDPCVCPPSFSGVPRIECGSSRR